MCEVAAATGFYGNQNQTYLTSRSAIFEEAMPMRGAAGVDNISERRRPPRQLHMTGPHGLMSTLLLLALIFFQGAAAVTLEESHLFRFLENILPNYRLQFNTSIPACDWPNGVICIGLGADRKIWELRLSGRELNGTILPNTLGALTSLMLLDLSNNLLTGNIPEDIFNLPSLTHLNLAKNRLTGVLSPSVANLSQLTTLDLSENLLLGPLPIALGELQLLTSVNLHSNKFSGTIPVFSETLYLQTLDLSSNQFSGSIPWAFNELAVLIHLNLSRNLLTGVLVWEFERLESLQVLDVSDNGFQGMIPNLEKLANLKAVSLSSNGFNGSIPPSLTSLLLLETLSVANNNLTGTLPVASWSGSSIRYLDCSNNLISGRLSPGMLAAPNLTIVKLASNNFTGPLPTSYSPKLRELDFQSNSFSGNISKSIFTLPALEKLELSSNQFGGSIPWDFVGSSSIRHVGLARNPFVEGLLLDVSRMVNITHLNLSSCNLGGPIPESFAAVRSLISLDLSHNHLNGSIPVGLSKITSLQFLDVSFNKLTGAIPSELTSLAYLSNVNFSYNKLSGEVPSAKQWATFKSSAFQGNPELCGIILKKVCSSGSPQLPPAPYRRRRRGHHLFKVGAVIGILVAILVTCCGFLAILLLLLNKKIMKLPAREVSKFLSSKLPVTFETDPSTWAVQVPQAGSIPVIMFEKPLLNLTFADLLQATSNFHKDNQISDSGYGPAFKGTLPGGFQIVVKVLFEGGPANEFEKAAQLEALGKIRHPNLVSLVGYCLVGEERLLVYEFMENGDLSRRLHELSEGLYSGSQNPDDWSKDTWEHPDMETRDDGLNWPVRHRIALGVARALAFLHHGCSPHLVHRDVTSSNILLDPTYEPHLAECGLAGLISSDDENPAIGGALGYVPPEYGHMWKATTRGDVYSFGVVLLELVTGKRPTGRYFHDSYGGNLVGWVRALVREKRGFKCLDPKLASSGSESEMLETLRIGYLCTAEVPSKRPTMQQIVGLLKDIQPDFTA